MRPGLTFDSFVTLPSNQAALEAAIRWASGREPRLVCLAGPTGTGKTHLARAAVARATAGSRVRWLSAEGAMNSILADLRLAGTVLGAWALDPDLLILEHLEDLEGKEHGLALIEKLLGRSPATALLTATCDAPASLPGVLAALGRLGASVALTRRASARERSHLARLLSRRAGVGGLTAGWWRHCQNAAEIAGELRLRHALRTASLPRS